MTDLPDWVATLNLPKFINQATEELESLALFRHAATFAFSLDANLVELLTALKVRFPDIEDAFAMLVAEAHQHQPFAQAEVESGMSYLGSLLVVRLVTILETCVGDAL